MQTVSHSPTDGIYPATSDYTHALEVRGADRLLFVAGTMGWTRPESRVPRSMSNWT